MTFRPLLACALLAGLLAPGCSTFSRSRTSYEDLEPGQVAQELDRAEAELAAGNARQAFDRLQVLWDVADLPSDSRDRAAALLEEATGPLIAETGSPRRLKSLFGDELPRRVRVDCGVASGRRYLERGRRMAAFRILKRVDDTFPTHHLRAESAALLSEIGFSLADDDGKAFLIFFPYRDNAPQVLEYLVLHYPSYERCPEAYVRLAELYAADREWELAIERYEDLLVYHPDSGYVVWSQAEIPHLRLASLRRPVYARRELVRARTELETWLARYPGDELAPRVQADLEDCLARLADSDLSVARFYERVDKPFGVRMHAQRAAVEAATAGDAERAGRAEALLSELPPDPEDEAAP